MSTIQSKYFDDPFLLSNMTEESIPKILKPKSVYNVVNRFLVNGNTTEVPDLYKRQILEPSAPPFYPTMDLYNREIREPSAPPLYPPKAANQNNNPLTAYKVAKLYVNTLDPAIEVTKKTARAVGRFTSAFSNTTLNLWNLGGKGCVKEAVKIASGATHFSNAVHVVAGSLTGKKISDIRPKEKMGLAEALGVASGHFCKGLSNAAISTVALTGTALYAWGTISNTFGYQPSNPSMHMAARLLAGGVNQGIDMGFNVTSQALGYAMPVMEGIIADPSTIYTTALLGATAVAMGTSFYYASSNFTKAADAHRLLPKFKHGIVATASLAATIAIPYLMYT